MDASSHEAGLDDRARSAVGPALLAWYDAHARTLPWRAPPGTPAPDPYRVWLSEVMLQQTTVAAVKSYFAEFTRRWPTVADLAAAPEGEVMAAWAGLGYYARARNLLACAREVAERGGTFPDNEDGLRTLPGLGAYTTARRPKAIGWFRACSRSPSRCPAHARRSAAMPIQSRPRRAPATSRKR